MHNRGIIGPQTVIVKCDTLLFVQSLATSPPAEQLPRKFNESSPQPMEGFHLVPATRGGTA